MNKYCFLLLGCILMVQVSKSQDNYEIQVYGSEILSKGFTMVELHSNYTFGGTFLETNGLFPTHHVLHETMEVTHGFTDYFEIGFYLFNAIGSGGRTNYVGSHIRPRICIPAGWHWPVGLSLSVEGGFQNKKYSADDWNVEIRPIIDKSIGKFYLAFNPTFDKSIHGLNSNKGYLFSPNFKASVKTIKICSIAVEYYGSIGKLFAFDPVSQQQHQVFAAADLNLSPNLEINFGYGVGLTKSTDNQIAKAIVGYRIK